MTGSPSKPKNIEIVVAVSNGQVVQSPAPVATNQATGGMSLDPSTMLGKIVCGMQAKERRHLARERGGPIQHTHIVA